jgi:hypothetical protein
MVLYLDTAPAEQWRGDGGVRGKICRDVIGALGVAARHHSGARRQFHHEACLGDGESLLLHCLVDGATVLLPDGCELVDAAHTTWPMVANDCSRIIRR